MTEEWNVLKTNCNTIMTFTSTCPHGVQLKHRLYVVHIIIILLLSTDPHAATFVKEFDIYPRKSIFSISVATTDSVLSYFCCMIWRQSKHDLRILQDKGIEFSSCRHSLL